MFKRNKISVLSLVLMGGGITYAADNGNDRRYRGSIMPETMSLRTDNDESTPLPKKFANILETGLLAGLMLPADAISWGIYAGKPSTWTKFGKDETYETCNDLQTKLTELPEILLDSKKIVTEDLKYNLEDLQKPTYTENTKEFLQKLEEVFNSISLEYNRLLYFALEIKKYYDFLKPRMKYIDLQEIQLKRFLFDYNGNFDLYIEFMNNHSRPTTNKISNNEIETIKDFLKSFIKEVKSQVKSLKRKLGTFSFSNISGRIAEIDSFLAAVEIEEKDEKIEVVKVAITEKDSDGKDVETKEAIESVEMLCKLAIISSRVLMSILDGHTVDFKKIKDSLSKIYKNDKEIVKIQTRATKPDKIIVEYTESIKWRPEIKKSKEIDIGQINFESENIEAIEAINFIDKTLFIGPLYQDFQKNELKNQLDRKKAEENMAKLQAEKRQIAKI